MYKYKAFITKVYDGDTVTADIDLGFGVELKGQKLRLMGINAPEVKGSERPLGLVSRDWLRAQVLGETVTIKTFMDAKGKYGRWLCDIFQDGVSKSVNYRMVEQGLAVLKDY